MQNIIIVQARMGSLRLPGKIMLSTKGGTILELVVKRLARSKLSNKIIVATTNQKRDDIIEEECKRIQVSCFRGSEENVLERYFLCAKKYKGDNIIRVTSDNPLISPELIDLALDVHIKKGYDFTSTNLNGRQTFPKGFDFQIMTFDALKLAYDNANTREEKEHVVVYLEKIQKKIKTYLFAAKKNDYLFKPHINFSVDYLEDYVFMYKLIKELKDPINARADEIVKIYENEF